MHVRPLLTRLCVTISHLHNLKLKIGKSLPLTSYLHNLISHKTQELFVKNKETNTGIADYTERDCFHKNLCFHDWTDNKFYCFVYQVIILFPKQSLLIGAN